MLNPCNQYSRGILSVTLLELRYERSVICLKLSLKTTFCGVFCEVLCEFFVEYFCLDNNFFHKAEKLRFDSYTFSIDDFKSILDMRYPHIAKSFAL